MRIAHVIDHFQPWLGYQEVQVPREQAGLGHTVCVFTSDRYIRNSIEKGRSRTAVCGRTSFDGVGVVRLPVYFEAPTEAGYMIMRGLGAALGDFAPDVVHCHNLLSFTAVHCALIRRRLRYTLIVDSHAADFNTFGPREPQWRKSIKHGLYRSFLAAPGRIIFEEANSIVTIGESELEFLESLIGGRARSVDLIRLGADSKKFAFDPGAREQIRLQMGWDAADVVLVHAGTLRPGKRVDSLVDACAILRSEGIPVRVNLIGRIDAAYRSELEEKLRRHSLAEHVVLTRFAAQDELNDYFSAADIGVWPGDPSVAVLEAMSSRLPVVAMRTPYTEAIIERPEAGALVNSTTSEALAAALRPLVTEGAERVRRGMNARNLIEQELNWGKIAESFVSLYASASSRNFKRSSKRSIGERRHAL